MQRNYFYSEIVLELTEDPTVFIPISATKVPYDGAWAFAKGDSTAKEEEEQTASFDQSLMSIFQSQYGTQQSQLKYLQGQMEPIINAGGQGYTPEQLAAQRTAASDTDSESYQQAQAQLNNQTSQMSGGSKLTGVSGANVESDAALDNAMAQKSSADQNQITTNNANLQQQNYWNAVNALNGVATEENPLGYAGESSTAGSTVAGLGNTVTNANQSQLLGALGGIAGGLGSAIGGKLAAGCWIASSFFGWSDVRTHIVRHWLRTKAPRWFRTLYYTHGENIAATPLRWAFRPIFEYVVRTEMA
jgi:hypothetical protein